MLGQATASSNTGFHDQHHLSEEELFESPTTSNADLHEKLRAAVYDVACVAHEHLAHARELSGQVPANAIPAMLPAVRTLADGAHAQPLC